MVLAAGKRQTPQSDHTLEELCRTYWFPLHAHVQRRGHSKKDAECLAEGDDRLFEVLKPFLTVGKRAIPYPQAATEFGVSEGAARSGT